MSNNLEIVLKIATLKNKMAEPAWIVYGKDYYNIPAIYPISYHLILRDQHPSNKYINITNRKMHERPVFLINKIISRK